MADRLVTRPSICSSCPRSTTSCAPVLRDLCEKEIAPHAADVDENARFPDEALKALNASGFHAMHIPEEYGGQGADSVATCIVIEEVARVVRVVVADPGGQQARHDGADPVRLGGAEAAGAAVDRLRRGDGVLRAVRARGRLRRRGDADPRPRRRRRLGAQRHQGWITNAGKSTWYTVMAVTDPDKGANGISAFVVHKRRPGLHRRAQGTQDRHQGLADHASCTSRTAASRATGSSASPAPASRPRCGRSTTPARPSARRPSASRRARWTPRSPTPRTASSSASRSATSRACSSCSPTWR